MTIAPMASSQPIPHTVSTSLDNFRDGSFFVTQSSTNKIPVSPIIILNTRENMESEDGLRGGILESNPKLTSVKVNKDRNA